jgi:hypothetical protein
MYYIDEKGERIWIGINYRNFIRSTI